VAIPSAVDQVPKDDSPASRFSTHLNDAVKVAGLPAGINTLASRAYDGRATSRTDVRS
jgi:hypothetical protein